MTSSGWLPVYALGLLLVVLSFPAPGIAGVVLALAGIALVWLAYSRSKREGSR